MSEIRVSPGEIGAAGSQAVSVSSNIGTASSAIGSAISQASAAVGDGPLAGALAAVAASWQQQLIRFEQSASQGSTNLAAASNVYAAVENANTVASGK